MLGFGYALIPKRDKYEKYEDTLNLIFMGFVALQDPPKNGVVEAVAACKTAQIVVTMVTGDHYLTGKAIALQVGILGEHVEEYVDATTVS